VLEPALMGASAHLGAEHPVTTDLQTSLGNVLWQIGQPARARDLLEASLATVTRQSGDGHASCLAIMNNLAMAYQELDDFPGARDILARALAAKQATLGPGHPSTAMGHHNLASTLRKMGDPASALPHHLKAMAIADTALADSDIMATIYHAAYGSSLLALARYDEARSILERSYEPLAEGFGAEHPRVIGVAADLSRVCEQLGDGAASALWRERSAAGR
jgi:tetratricopeptide (TPR) repeat protein